MKRFKSILKNKGLTLIELLITISIISILASVVFMSINDARVQARDTKRIVEVDQIEKAIVAYRMDNKGVPPGIEGVEYVNGNPEWIPGLVPKYLAILPSDPIDKDEHRYHYMRQGNDYVVAAQLEVSNEANNCSTDGTCTFYQKNSGNKTQIMAHEETGWKFSSSKDVVWTDALNFTCPNPEEQVEICHRPEGNNTNAQTLTVACTAVGPQGHSNHAYDTLGPCFEPEPVPEPVPEPIPEAECLVNILPATSTYTTGTPAQITWDASCYSSSQVLLEIRKQTDSQSVPYIMIYSAAPNTGTYQYQGFPSSLSGTDQWVVRVTNDNPRTIYDESTHFSVTNPILNTPEPTPEPEPENLSLITIKGRFVNSFTSQPIPGVAVKGVVPPATTFSTILLSGANGEFSFTATTDDIATTKAKMFSYNMSCYVLAQSDPLATIARNSDQSLRLHTNNFDLIRRGSLYRNPLTTNIVDLGDVPLWPGKNITINSDIPVKFRIPFPEEAGASGNTLFKTQHTLSNVIPLDYPFTVELTNQNGTLYISPVKRYTTDAGCAVAVLNFSNGEFSWDN